MRSSCVAGTMVVVLVASAVAGCGRVRANLSGVKVDLPSLPFTFRHPQGLDHMEQGARIYSAIDADEIWGNVGGFIVISRATRRELPSGARTERCGGRDLKVFDADTATPLTDPNKMHVRTYLFDHGGRIWQVKFLSAVSGFPSAPAPQDQMVGLIASSSLFCESLSFRTVQTPLAIIDATDVDFAVNDPDEKSDQHGVRIRLRITGSREELRRWAGPPSAQDGPPGDVSAPLPGNQICVVSKTGENHCDWWAVHFFNAKTGGTLAQTMALVQDKPKVPSASPIVMTTRLEPKSAEVFLSLDPNDQGDDADLIFTGVAKSEVASVRLGQLASATIR